MRTVLLSLFLSIAFLTGCSTEQPTGVVIQIDTCVESVSVWVNGSLTALGNLDGECFTTDNLFLSTGPLFEKDTVEVSLGKEGFWFYDQTMIWNPNIFTSLVKVNDEDDGEVIGYAISFSWKDDEWGVGDPPEE